MYFWALKMNLKLVSKISIFQHYLFKMRQKLVLKRDFDILKIFDVLHKWSIKMSNLFNNYKWSFNQIQNTDLLFCAEKQLKRWYNLTFPNGCQKVKKKSI